MKKKLLITLCVAMMGMTLFGCETEKLESPVAQSTTTGANDNNKKDNDNKDKKEADKKDNDNKDKKEADKKDNDNKDKKEADKKDEPAKHFEKIGSESAVSEFGVNLLKTCSADKNKLVSPLSVYVALAMTTDGAAGNTLAEMEKTLGLTNDEMKDYVASYMNTMDGLGSNTITMANSIWSNDDYGIEYKDNIIDDFENCYKAELFNRSFDNDTLAEINGWVENNTDGMIKNLLDEITPDAVMFLINAITFEAQWENEYEEAAIYSEDFTMEDGTTKGMEFMHSDEGLYLSDENTTGVMKYYKDKRFAFVGLLPNEGISMDEYVDSLTGEKVNDLINGAEQTTVITKIPEFSNDYKLDLVNNLNELGINEAFTGDADFSNFTGSDDGMFISKVIHQTHIEVNREGTKAAAATAVEMDEEAVSVVMPDIIVSLDRPFVYVIYDMDQDIPLFIGTMEE